MGPKKVCQVCQESHSKYKCPTCFIPYCSLLCFKKHKENPCAKPVPSSEAQSKSTTNPVVDIERPFYVDDPNKMLQQSQFESIASSSVIRDALKDEELQKLICSIDGSGDAEMQLEKAMEQEAFRQFTDKILSTISP